MFSADFLLNHAIINSRIGVREPKQQYLEKTFFQLSWKLIFFKIIVKE